MTQHQQIIAELERQYEFLKAADIVAPSSLAYKVYEHFSRGKVEAHIQYTSIEHLKNMASKFLAKRNNPNADDNEVYDQTSFEFSGQLQARYPIPHKKGEEPVYKLRSHLTPEERAWNVKLLRKSARSRLEHADALEAEGQMRAAA
jgi:hypothetical protein